MSVKLREKHNSDGSITPYLDIYHMGKRSYEFLINLKIRKPKSKEPIELQANRENRILAKKIELKRAQELSASDYAITTETGKRTEVVPWLQAYVDGYKKKDKRNMQGALNRFSKFLNEEKLTGLTFGKLNEIVVSDFQDSLRASCTGEGSSSYFSRFKKMIKQAWRQKLIANNPAAEVRTVQGTAKKRDILTLEEIQNLANTPTESDTIKRAFLFSCLTGLRWIEVSSLKWENINLAGKYVDVHQTKTDKHKRVNLNETAIKLLGDRGNKEKLVFNLPTANGANKTLKAWVKRAGIQKSITWHNARHSFGTNLLFTGANLAEARELLGHTSFKHTQRYVTAAAELKQKATEKLNIQF